jgi:hypothetical protein
MPVSRKTGSTTEPQPGKEEKLTGRAYNVIHSMAISWSL